MHTKIGQMQDIRRLFDEKYIFFFIFHFWRHYGFMLKLYSKCHLLYIIGQRFSDRPYDLGMSVSPLVCVWNEISGNAKLKN